MSPKPTSSPSTKTRLGGLFLRACSGWWWWALLLLAGGLLPLLPLLLLGGAAAEAMAEAVADEEVADEAVADAAVVAEAVAGGAGAAIGSSSRNTAPAARTTIVPGARQARANRQLRLRFPLTEAPAGPPQGRLWAAAGADEAASGCYDGAQRTRS